MASDALRYRKGAQMVSVTPLDEGKLSVAERSNSSLTKQPTVTNTGASLHVLMYLHF